MPADPVAKIINPHPMKRQSGTRAISLVLQSILYIAAGINHFLNPQVYRKIMPAYLPAHNLLISASGIIEISLGIMLAFQPTRKLAACCIIAMLLAFIPAHIEMIRISGCSFKDPCLAFAIAWLRLIPGQLLLIAWAWYQRK